jgi:pimeloyl-ACP methyl ester carboxylesterase
MLNLRTPLLLTLLFCSHSIFSQVAVDSIGTFTIGGIKQFVSIKGKDNTKPLLLFLHGGPGNSVMPYADKFTGKLKEHFIVVQWDQREAGRTLALNASPQPLNVARFKNDTRELIDTLLNRFKKKKLFLAGHSWGTYLGFHIAINHPDLLYAYIPICPMVDQLESERIILGLMKDKAVSDNDHQAKKELDVVHIPFENGEQLFYHRKWVLKYMGSKAKITKQQVQGWSASWLSIFNDASKENLFVTAPKINCPVYFCVGRKDYQTNATITEKYFQFVSAPKKALFWFERSAHALPTTEPELLQDVIIKQILPDVFLDSPPRE